MAITPPLADWFFQTEHNKKITNEYTGSVRAEEDKGTLHTYTFNYFVRVNTEADDPILELKTFWIAPWSEKLTRSKDAEASFPCTPEGIAEAEKWLDARLADGH